MVLDDAGAQHRAPVVADEGHLHGGVLPSARQLEYVFLIRGQG
jgi:hypothetical protein